MEPRRHRLGDVVDDYCPRERRLSNHVIVAMVDDLIKQTRCSTCDFEHPFKEGKVPARRAKKDATSALYQQVLDNVTEGGVGDPPPRPSRRVNGTPPPADVTDEAPRPALVAPRPVLARPERPEPAPIAAAPPPVPDTPPPAHDEGPVHRTLIRATLPRVEGEPREPRPIPTFTVREAATRPKFRRFPRPQHAGRNAQPFGHGGQPSPFTAQPRGPGGNHKGGGPQGNRAGGHQHHQQGNRNQRRGNKGR
jgi:hypothetical protein